MLEKCHDLPSGVRSIQRNKPDMVFLDLELPYYSGLQLLDFLDTQEINFALIFTTASNQHAINAFEMSAIDYILKPIQEEKIRNAIQKVKHIKNQQNVDHISVLKSNLEISGFNKMVVQIMNGYEILNLSEILFLKAEGSYTRIYLQDKESLMVSKNLKYFDEILDSVPYFIRIHRSYIANIHMAKRIIRKDGYLLVIDDSNHLPVINDKVDEIIKFINS